MIQAVLCLVCTLCVLARGVDASPPQHEAAALFKNLFQTSVDTFLSDYFQTKLLHVPRNESGYFSGLLSLEDIDWVLEHGMSVYDDNVDPTVAMVAGRDGSLVKRVKGKDGAWWTGAYPNKSLSLPVAHKAFKSGFTLIINRLNYRWRPVAELCHRLALEVFGFRTNANLYLTPARSQGFEAHFDWMESIVLQLSGQKQWTMYDFLIRYPYSHLKFKPTESQLGSSTGTINMTPGTVLYFPSGMGHEAQTESSQVSLHVTLGVEIDELYTLTGLIHVAIHLSAQRLDRLNQPIVRHVGSDVNSPLSWKQTFHLAVEELSRRVPDIRRVAPLQRYLIRSGNNLPQADEAFKSVFLLSMASATEESSCRGAATLAQRSELTTHLHIVKMIGDIIIPSTELTMDVCEDQWVNDVWRGLWKQISNTVTAQEVLEYVVAEGRSDLIQFTKHTNQFLELHERNGCPLNDVTLCRPIK
eukprot:GILJ01009765.1.p1 GENE.GILJ01009765.1~~GILJ01009765.1.p1  ORF type:complete len:471 (-),score=58.09 GILJ01009765.1:5-1417(-)